MADTREKTPFFKNLKGEFKRIIWPDKQRVAKQTVAVISVSVVVGVIIAIIDAVVKFGLGLIM